MNQHSLYTCKVSAQDQLLRNSHSQPSKNPWQGKGGCVCPDPKLPELHFSQHGFDDTTTEVKSKGSTLRGKEIPRNGDIPRNYHIPRNDGLTQGREWQHKWSCSCLSLSPGAPPINHLDLVMLCLVRHRGQNQLVEKIPVVKWFFPCLWWFSPVLHTIPNPTGLLSPSSPSQVCCGMADGELKSFIQPPLNKPTRAAANPGDCSAQPHPGHSNAILRTWARGSLGIFES